MISPKFLKEAMWVRVLTLRYSLRADAGRAAGQSVRAYGEAVVAPPGVYIYIYIYHKSA